MAPAGLRLDGTRKGSGQTMPSLPAQSRHQSPPTDTDRTSTAACVFSAAVVPHMPNQAIRSAHFS